MSTERERDPDTVYEKPADYPELEALSIVIRTLQGLPAATTQRVLAAAAAFLDVPLRGAVGLGSARSDDHALGGRVPQMSLFSEDRTPGPKEFLLDKRSRSDVEKVVCLAYYLTHYRDTPQFRAIELGKLNTEAAQPKFSSLMESAEGAIREGLLLPTSKSMLRLSPLGELYVQALPDRDAAREALGQAVTKAKRQSRTANHPEEGDATDLAMRRGSK